MPKAKKIDSKGESKLESKLECNVKNYSNYERTRILGARTLQISDNAPIYVKADKITNSYELAKKEFNEGRIPLKVIKK